MVSTQLADAWCMADFFQPLLDHQRQGRWMKIDHQQVDLGVIMLFWDKDREKPAEFPSSTLAFAVCQVHLVHLETLEKQPTSV